MAKRVVTTAAELLAFRKQYARDMLKMECRANVADDVVAKLKAEIEKLTTRVYALEESVSLKKVREGLSNDQRVMSQNPQIAIAL